MKVIAYSVQPYEKELLAKANQKKHDITLIFNSLNLETVAFASGKLAVVVSNGDDVSAEIISKLCEFGIRYITIRSVNTGYVDMDAARKCGIKLANTPDQQDTATQTIRNLDLWEINKCVGKACLSSAACKI
jgi:lactate dehydrogenase-like 2-hydroxyacid dehydrogenase